MAARLRSRVAVSSTEAEEDLKRCSYPELLLKVRKLWSCNGAFTCQHEGRWYVSWFGATHGGDLGDGNTEEEALLDAIKCAR